MERNIEITAVAPIIISGIPADTGENRARLRESGFDPDRIPWPQAYMDSTSSECEGCSSEIWIGPITGRTMEEITTSGGTVTILCLFCCASMAYLGADVKFVPLTDKKEGE